MVQRKISVVSWFEIFGVFPCNSDRRPVLFACQGPGAARTGARGSWRFVLLPARPARPLADQGRGLCRADRRRQRRPVAPCRSRRGPVVLLVAAEQVAARTDPCAALAAHEQEVGLAWSSVLSCRSRGQIKLLNHHLAGALIDVGRVAVGPDMGPGLGADLDDVLAQHAAGPADSVVDGVRPPVVVAGRGAPFPVGECRLPEIAGCLDEITSDRKAGPRHAGIGA